MSRRFAPQLRASAVCFLLLLGVGLVWALYTRHAWEDYYITYRASKNLATGHGLTFTPGERIHSFTSPLGVLLPALASVATGNRSDTAALWIFRVASLAAFAGAGVFLWKTLRECSTPPLICILVLTIFGTETKLVDFSGNGMETGFLLLFLCWTLHTLVSNTRHAALGLGAAWAGLMWTRPDSFIYIGALALGAWMFRGPAARNVGRSESIRQYLRAGAITTLLYLPWLLWAWGYYGSPVPHTVRAKGLFGEPNSLHLIASFGKDLPRLLKIEKQLLASTFMPAYSLGTGWPLIGSVLSFWISLFAALAWLIPSLKTTARITSFSFLVGQLYLACYVGFPVPWYLPTVTLLALVTVGLALGQMMGSGNAVAKSAAILTAGILAVGTMVIFVLGAYHFRLQQRIIEDGNRTHIGKWLRVHAESPQDTVFLEPLGYIGFYSGLKMLDYPGLCSEEMIQSRLRASSHAYPYCWSELITDLLPDWLVLRPYEEASIRDRDPALLSESYVHAETFDVRSQIDAISFLPGRGYLLNDARFEVYHRKPHLTRNGTAGRIVGLKRITNTDLLDNESWGHHPAYFSDKNLVANAPSRVVVSKPAGAGWLVGGYGIFAGAYENPKGGTDGAEFVITWISAAGLRRELFRQALNPRAIVDDRGEHSFNLPLPTEENGRIELVTGVGAAGDPAFDWTFWSSLTFEMAHTSAAIGGR